MPKKIYLVSACLLGLPTRYDGAHNRIPQLYRLCRRCRCIPLCPEQLGGLATPRCPAEISGGDGAAVLRGEAAVLDRTGKDLTAQFLQGAQTALKLARLFRVDGAIFKSGSPSCGSGSIYDGAFSGNYRSGDGVAAALLKQHGFPVFSEKSLPPGWGIRPRRRQPSSRKRRSPR